MWRQKCVLFGVLSFLYCSCLFGAANTETPVMFDDMLGEFDMASASPWRAPNYSNQSKALGYDVGAFGIPAGMEERVSFWLDIYTKFNTDQGLLHDSRSVRI